VKIAGATIQNLNANAMKNFTNNAMNTFITSKTKSLPVSICLDELFLLRFLYSKILFWQIIVRLLTIQFQAHREILYCHA